MTDTMDDMIRRAPREIAYCAISTVHGFVGLGLVVFWLIPSMAMAMTVVFSAVAPLLIIAALFTARLMGSLQRWILVQFVKVTVDPPSRFSSGKGVVRWIENRITDRVAWRAVGYLVARAPLLVLQGGAIAFAGCGAADFLYPLFWRLVHPHTSPGGGPGPVRVLSPFPMGGLAISTWPGAFLVSGIGVGFIAVAVLLAHYAVVLDGWLAQALLGPGALTERVRELERTRSLAVDSAAEALRRVERDLHDGAQVRLTALALHLGMAREQARVPEPDLAAIRELLTTADGEARGALSELRDLARGIHPPVLDNGLPSAFASLAAASALPVTVSADLPRRPSPAIEAIAYFCAAELVANAVKHSFANQVAITLSAERSGVLVITVADDGVGGADPARGSGLKGLMERVAVVDGALGVSAPPGGPTVVTVELPLEA